jgi:hypothetical protein
MSHKFNLNKYESDKGKSYEFCKKHRTIEDDVDASTRQLSNRLNRLSTTLFHNSNENRDLQTLADNCPKLDILDCCKLKLYKRTKPECQVCIGNV